MPRAARAGTPPKEGDRRLLNLLFTLNASRAPLTTEQIVGDPDLGYGSENRASDKKKFARDRERLAEMGIFVRESRATGSAMTEESLWSIDRERTHVSTGTLAAGDIELVADAVKTYLERADAPFRAPLERVRAKLSLFGGDPDGEIEPVEDDPVLDALWSAFVMKRSIGVAYTDGRGERSRRTLAIYGIFTLEGHCYVTALDDATGSVRTFRADRIQRVYRPGHPYTVPADFDIGDYLFLPFDFAAGTGIESTFTFPAGIGKGELDQITRGRGDLSSSPQSTRWDVTVRDLDAAARFALQHASMGMRPQAPRALVDAWESLVHKAVSAHA